MSVIDVVDEILAAWREFAEAQARRERCARARPEQPEAMLARDMAAIDRQEREWRRQLEAS